MAGCFGSHPEDKFFERMLHKHLAEDAKDDAREERIEALAKDKFMGLPNLYKSSDGVERYSNMDDAIGSVKQEELICIARAVRDGDNKLAGDLLAAALMRVCVSDAEDEISDKEFEDD